MVCKSAVGRVKRIGRPCKSTMLTRYRPASSSTCTPCARTKSLKKPRAMKSVKKVKRVKKPSKSASGKRKTLKRKAKK